MCRAHFPREQLCRERIEMHQTQRVSGTGFKVPTRWMVAVLMALACLSARAQASCGDYLHTRMSSSGPDSVNGSELSFPGEPHQGAIPVVPCRGPNCSQQSKPLIPPQPLVIRSAPEKVAVSAVGEHYDCSTKPRLLEPERLAIPIRQAIHIFRPPRAVRSA
jgi:hypothetical protein